MTSVRGPLWILWMFFFLVSCNPISVEKKSSISISSLSATEASIYGGTRITINGSDFIGIESVTFGSKLCTDVIIVSETTLTCILPSNGAGEVVVTILGKGNRIARTTFTYTYDDLTLTSVTPNGGKKSEESLITLRGTGFQSTSEITIDDSDCTPVVFIDSTLMKCTAPAKDAGDYTLTITNSNGQTTERSFTYKDQPVITSIEPDFGSNLGGTIITIFGSNFSTGATVKIGSRTCYDVTVDEDEGTITCTAPIMSKGTYNVTVTNPDLQPATLNASYTAEEIPLITSLSVSSGPSSGGTTINIIGKNFSNTSTVSIGGVACATLTYFSSLRLNCVTAEMSSETYDVVVTNTNGHSGTLENGFTFIPPPEIEDVSPGFGRLTAGTEITITGSHFLSGATVAFGTDSIANFSACTNVQVEPDRITCSAPARAEGVVNVYVTNPDGQSAVSTSAYRFQGPPTITSISPLVGDPDGDTTIEISGTNFSEGVSVLFGSHPIDDADACTDVQVTPTRITCSTPAREAGVVNVYVTNTDDQEVTSSSAYTYRYAATVSNVSPNKGPSGRTITITGENFVSGITVTLGGNACTGVDIDESGNSLTCVTPVSVVFDAVDLVVYNLNDISRAETVSDAYTYQRAPEITTILPVQGTSLGGTEVTITGNYFLNDVEVTIGGVVCEIQTVNTTSIVCITGAADYENVGNVDVVVRNDDNQQAIETGGFKYLIQPEISEISQNAGPPGGGTTITITGRYLFPDQVYFGVISSLCENISVNSEGSLLTCDTPAHESETVALTINSVDNLSDSINFTFRNPPSIESVSPTWASIGATTAITIIGTDFLDGATVMVGEVPCLSVAFVDSETINCTVPDNISAGAKTVVVTNPDDQPGDLDSGFTVIGPPTIVANDPINPASGPSGTIIQISGTNFGPGVKVYLGEIHPDDECTVTNSTFELITCVTNSTRKGETVDVIVLNPDSTSVTKNNAFLYTESSPTIYSANPVTPTSGPDGTTITIFGTDFFPGATVILDTNNGISCNDVEVNDARTEITCTTGAYPGEGTVDIRVTNLDGGTVTTDGAVYTNLTSPPTIIDISPATVAVGELITITGTNLSASTVLVDSFPCIKVSNTATTITCYVSAENVPLGEAFDVSVSQVDGSDEEEESVTFIDGPPPTYMGIDPSSGRSGDTVTITGTNLNYGTIIEIGDTPCTLLEVQSSTSVTCTLGEPAVYGLTSLLITNLDGYDSGSQDDVFTYLAPE